MKEQMLFCDEPQVPDTAQCRHCGICYSLTFSALSSVKDVKYQPM